MGMTKRGVPGVWTYGFYDGWTPNYMFYAVHSHNALGRFYEVSSFNPGTAATYPGKTAGGAPAASPAPAAAQGGGGGRGGRGGGGGGGRGGGNSREWFRPNPDPGNVNWGPRAHVNMSQSAVLFALNFTAREK